MKTLMDELLLESNKLKKKHIWLVKFKQYLPHCKLYLVGGFIRDLALKVETFNNVSHNKDIQEYTYGKSKDIDLVVEGIDLATLESCFSVLKNDSYIDDYDMVGAHFPVYKLKYDGETIDVAVTRTEISTGPRHSDFTINFNNVTIEEDLKRRDFTVNAIAYEIFTKTLYDPLNGLKDIKSKRLILCNRESFVEDPLRMLRALQFALRFGFSFDSELSQELVECAPRITFISLDRVIGELAKIPSNMYMRASIFMEQYKMTSLLFNNRKPINHRGLNNSTLVRFLHTVSGGNQMVLKKWPLTTEQKKEWKVITLLEKEDSELTDMAAAVRTLPSIRSDHHLMQNRLIHLMPVYSSELFTKPKDLLDIGVNPSKISKWLTEIAVEVYKQKVVALKTNEKPNK